MVRIAVRIEAERDDDDAARTGAGGVSRAVRIAVRIEGRRRRSDDDWDNFLWLPFVATVCGYRLWLPSDPRGWVRIEVRIAVRTPVRIEDERTTTGAGAVPKCSAKCSA